MLSLMKRKRRKVRRATYWSKVLPKLRDKLGLTQAEAAKRAEVGFSTWRAWEYGYNVPTDAAARILRMAFPELK